MLLPGRWVPRLGWPACLGPWLLAMRRRLLVWVLRRPWCRPMAVHGHGLARALVPCSRRHIGILGWLPIGKSSPRGGLMHVLVGRVVGGWGLQLMLGLLGRLCPVGHCRSPGVMSGAWTTGAWVLQRLMWQRLLRRSYGAGPIHQALQAPACEQQQQLHSEWDAKVQRTHSTTPGMAGNHLC